MANKKNEAKIKFTAETGDFNDSIKKANREMTELRAEMKLNETQMKNAGVTVETLEAKHENLEKQLKASHDKTEALNQKVQKAVEIFGEDSEEVSKLRVQLTNAQNAEEKLKQAVNACTNEIEEQKRASKEAESATNKLSSEIKQQESELSRLKRQYADYVVEGKDATKEARELANEIDALSRSLKENKDRMEDASDKANKLDRSFDGAGKSADNASGGGFTVMKGALADLASNVIQEVLSKIKELISYMAELPEATREFRQDMATLTTSFDTAGFSTETAKDAWKDLYAIFGEDDRAVEASNLISKMAKNQEDLNDWVTITAGVWGAYQDSLPVEGLAEASMETARTGKVTGVLADALNWSAESSRMFAKYIRGDVVTAEDAFNVALSKCNSEQERQALITSTLMALYDDSAETYNETAKQQMEAKEASAELLLAEAELANAIEPVTTEFTKLKTELLVYLTPVVKEVCQFILDAITWLKEHPKVIEGVITAITALVGSVTWLIAVGVALYRNWDEITAKCKELAQNLITKFTEIKDHVSGKIGLMKDYMTNRFEEMRTNGANVFNSLKTSISNAMDSAKDKVKNALDSINKFFANLKLALPKIKVPHFKISGTLSLSPPSVPKISIDWYKDGGIMTKPTIFGINGNRLMAGGEAGAEAILPIDRLQGYIESAMAKTSNVINMNALADRIEELANRPIEMYIGDRQIAMATANANDNVNGLRSTFSNRGLVL